MDPALSTMKAADARPAHLSWTGLAAKSESPQFSSGFILAHQLWKIGHQMNSDFNSPGAVFKHQITEAGVHSIHITDIILGGSQIILYLTPQF